MHWAVPIALRGSRSKRTQNIEPLVNGHTVEENEGLRSHIRWTKPLLLSTFIVVFYL